MQQEPPPDPLPPAVVDPAQQLVEACRDGDEARVAELLAAGGDVDAASDDAESQLQLNFTSLGMASWEGRAHIVTLLLAAGASVDLVDGDDCTALAAQLSKIMPI
jgi:hypothetical protein